MPEITQVHGNGFGNMVDWTMIESLKTEAREKARKEQEEIRAKQDAVWSQQESKSARRYANVRDLLFKEIGPALHSFQILGDDADDVLMSANGLATMTRASFSLNLPEHNPIHVMLQFGQFAGVAFAENDVPAFLTSEKKFSVYLDPTYRRQVVNRVRLVKRVGEVVSDKIKCNSFNDFGEALLAAEEAYKESKSTNSIVNSFLAQHSQAEDSQGEAVARQLLAEEMSSTPENTDLKSQIEKLFTLSQKYPEQSHTVTATLPLTLTANPAPSEK